MVKVKATCARCSEPIVLIQNKEESPMGQCAKCGHWTKLSIFLVSDVIAVREFKERNPKYKVKRA